MTALISAFHQHQLSRRKASIAILTHQIGFIIAYLVISFAGGSSVF
jgi:hypothetical protein